MSEIIMGLLSEQILISLVIIGLTAAIVILIRKYEKKLIKKNTDNREGINKIHILFSMVCTLAMFICFITVLQVNGINISALITGLGIVSAIVGLALQDYLKDIIMGIHIITNGFYRVGDCVEYDGREGKIISITLKATKIEDLDDCSVTTVCNRNISQIRRFGERLDIDVSLSYGEDVKTVSEALEKISAEITRLDKVDKCKFIGTQSFEKSSILYRVRVFCAPETRADTRRKALGIIQNGLLEAGITIPFEQLDVHCNIENKPSVN